MSDSFLAHIKVSGHVCNFDRYSKSIIRNPKVYGIELKGAVKWFLE